MPAAPDTQSLISNKGNITSTRVGGDAQTNHEAPTAEGASCNPLRHHCREVIVGHFARPPYKPNSMCLNTDRPIRVLDSEDLNGGHPGLLLGTCRGGLHDQAPLVAALVVVETQTNCQGANAQTGERCTVMVQVAGDADAAGAPPGQVFQVGLRVTPEQTSDNSTIW